MIFITKETWGKNSVEVIPDGDIKWLNQKNVEKQLGHSNLTQITTKYSKDLGKQRCELQEYDKQSTRLFMIE